MSHGFVDLGQEICRNLVCLLRTSGSSCMRVHKGERISKSKGSERGKSVTFPTDPSFFSQGVIFQRDSKPVTLFGSSLFSVGDDEIQRNNQEIRKRKRGMRAINHRGHSRCPSMDLKKERGRIMDIRSWPSSPVPIGFVTSLKRVLQFVY